MVSLAFITIFATIIVSASIARSIYRRKSPPLTALRWRWLFLLASLIGVVLVFTQFSRLDASLAQKKWPAITGTITGAEITKDKASWPVITYEYTIDGKVFEKTTSLKFPGFGGRTNRLDAAKKAVSQFATGDTVTVYYNPFDPATSYLKPGPTWDVFGQLGLGVTLLGLGCFFFSASFRSIHNNNGRLRNIDRL